MAREFLDQKIRHLMDEILLLDSMVEQATLDSVDALKRRDVEAAKRAYALDDQVNAKRFEIEIETMATIATQQPVMGKDLRLLASILEIVGELERMGDYAKGIAKICIMIGEEPHIKPLIDIPRMADIAIKMLHSAVGAFVSGDVGTARVIPKQDDEVDALYNQVQRELATIILADPTTIDRANFLLWAAHNLERMADRVTNICERTIYVATGVLKELGTSDDEYR